MNNAYAKFQMVAYGFLNHAWGFIMFDIMPGHSSIIYHSSKLFCELIEQVEFPKINSAHALTNFILDG